MLAGAIREGAAFRAGIVDSGTAVVSGVLLLVLALLLVFLGRFLSLWIQARLSGADVGLIKLVGMSLRRVDVASVLRSHISSIQAGIRVPLAELEAHYLAGGDVARVVHALIAADRAGLGLEFRKAAAIDLAGRDVLEAVQTSVHPRVIDCPDSSYPGASFSGQAKNGIRVLAKARVTVRTNLGRLVGGATEQTIVARVGQGIVSAIGETVTHMGVLANPSLISVKVLREGLDAGTAFDILSIDIAELEVGDNVGARIQAEQAEADLKVARARAEERRAMAIATEQECSADVVRASAELVRAEASVPLALAEAYRCGLLLAPLPRPSALSADQLEVTRQNWAAEALRRQQADRRITAWSDHPLVVLYYINPRVSGDPHLNWVAGVQRRYVSAPVERILTIGCGDGSLERQAVGYGFARHAEGIDISPGAIEVAKRLAAEAGVADRTFHRAADVTRIDLPLEHYDFVFFAQSLHHIEDLSSVLVKARDALKPDGLLVANEFVGPDKFQWTEAQLEYSRALLLSLPERLRIRASSGELKNDVRRPTLAEMDATDPTEAIHSSDILAEIGRHFDVVEQRDYGGTIQQILLDDIAWNFRSDDPDAVKELTRIAESEDFLVRTGVLPSDFTLVVARKPRVAAG